MIPKLSAPLVKDIRTGEGILEWILAGLGVIAGATGNLSIAHTGLYLTIVAAEKGARRGLLKIVAAQKGYNIGAPLLPAVLGEIGTLEPAAAKTVDEVLTEISDAKAAVDTYQSKPGTPADAIAAGLAPEPQGAGQLGAITS